LQSTEPTSSEPTPEPNQSTEPTSSGPNVSTDPNESTGSIDEPPPEEIVDGPDGGVEAPVTDPEDEDEC
jgi:hypothetical protein